MIKNSLISLIIVLPFFACNNASTTDTSHTFDSIVSKPEAEPKIVEPKKFADWDSIKNSDEDYTKFIKLIKRGLINQKQVIKKEGGKEEIVYLGTIIDKNGKTISHVFTIYAEVQAAIVIHGNSRILLIKDNLKEQKQYYMHMSEELPFKLENNNLSFHYLNKETNKEEIFENNIGMELPIAMCFSPNACR